MARPAASGRCSFWPKDFTFVCPTEIVGYGELKADFTDRDAELIGASTDTAHVHFAWRRSDEQLAGADFPWIADNKKELAEALGILDKDEGVALRATFIVDPENIIQHVTVNGLNVAAILPRRSVSSMRCRPTSFARATGRGAKRF